MTETWEPIREAHSIESVAAVVQFPSALNDAMLRKMLRAADANADEMNLPVRETMTGFQLNIGPAGPFAATVPTVDHAPINKARWQVVGYSDHFTPPARSAVRL